MDDREKVRVRGEVRRALERATPDERASWSMAVRTRLAAFEPVRSARAILAFASTGDEIDAWPFVQNLLDRGTVVCLPRIDWDAKTMLPAVVTDLGTLVARRHAVLEPTADAPTLPVADLDLILVPGVAFDERCNRLGRGGGFYDRFLSVVPASVLTVGVAFEVQVVHSVPMDRHDRPLDAVVTESRILRRA